MNKKKVIIAAIVLALVLSIGGVLAYFSDSATATNTFTVGKVKITLTEPTWTSTGAAKAAHVLSNQLIEKDPTITNSGENDAYVFIKVTIPKETIVVEAQDGSGSATTGTEQPLFDLIDSAGAVGVNSGWELMTTTQVTGATEYIYSYSSSNTMTALAKNASTPALFTKIRFANVQENWGVENTTKTVEVTGYAIQTENLNGGTTTNTGVWAILSANAIHTGS